MPPLSLATLGQSKLAVSARDDRSVSTKKSERAGERDNINAMRRLPMRNANVNLKPLRSETSGPSQFSTTSIILNRWARSVWKCLTELEIRGRLLPYKHGRH